MRTNQAGVNQLKKHPSKNGISITENNKKRARASALEHRRTAALQAKRRQESEMCHLKEHNYGGLFYALMDRLMPDWRGRRGQLNQIEVA